MAKPDQKVVVLDNIRSVYNVGSIFRTADALGIDRIYLCGTTPAPKDRFGRDRTDLAKVALGAEKNIPWKAIGKTGTILKKLKKDGFNIIAIEQHKKSKDLDEIEAEYPVAVVMGNEVGGLNKSVLKLCDIIAEMPMRGKKESLNVSVAFGIAGYKIFDK